MLLWITLTAALAATAMQDPADAAATVAPVVGDEVFLAAHVDLARADLPAYVGRVAGAPADHEDLPRAIQALGAWSERLKKAGVRDLFVLFDPADIPGFVAAVPLSPGADSQAIADALGASGPNLPFKLPARETIRGVVVAGSAGAVARIGGVRPAPRPEFAEALAAGGATPIRLVFMPSSVQRRAIDESMANLPDALGGGPITTVTRGVRWVSVGLDLGPAPRLHATVQADSPAAATEVQKVIESGLASMANEVRRDPALTALARGIGDLKPHTQADRVTIEADLTKATELAAVPLGHMREATRRNQCINNLKQIGLAMHNYHGTYNHFPAAFSTSKDGKPLLSWRVQILPYVEAQALYNEFHHDEPWDSPHNKALIPRMPRVYASPSARPALAREGKTTYLTLRGPKTIFPGSEGVSIKEITDGTSNTLLVVDADDPSAVVWTNPEDFEVTPEFSMKGLFGHHPHGTDFLFGDGSVRFLKETIEPQLLQDLSTRNGGEVISSDRY